MLLQKYICKLPKIVHLLVSVYRTALLLPSIMRRIEDQLIVKEINARFFQHVIDEHHLLAALTPTAAGAEFNYERLELLGPFGGAVLKRISLTIIYLYR